jgi:threonine/homoserine efflux transporter RhtA
MVYNSLPIEPIVALLAGILVLLMPRLLNYVVAVYLIVIGVMGLAPHFVR